MGRAVFKEVLKTSQGELPLKADLVLEFVELSSELFSALDQCMEVMVPLLQRASSLMTAEEDKAVVVRWAWASVYQPNLEKGVVLPQKFHDHMCSLLAALEDRVKGRTFVCQVSQACVLAESCTRRMQSTLITPAV